MHRGSVNDGDSLGHMWGCIWVCEGEIYPKTASVEFGKLLRSLSKMETS